MESTRFYIIIGVCAAAIFIGCAPHVPIKEHRLIISEVRQSTIQNLERELKAKKYNVQVEHSETKYDSFDDDVKDHTFVIRSDDYTEADLRKVTDLIENLKYEDPIELESMEVVQNFVSASGRVKVKPLELKIEVTENANAFYKKTGEQIELNRHPGHQSATFEYLRKEGEEYVDIYILPDYAEKNDTPKYFYRIDLYSPYTVKKIPWKRFYVRFWDWLKKLAGKSE